MNTLMQTVIKRKECADAELCEIKKYAKKIVENRGKPEKTTKK
jgi:hypothetical protein